jgi:hypothetical protein
MKNEMPSLILDEKICFIRLPANTLQNFWQVVMMFKLIANWLHGWSEHLRDGKNLYLATILLGGLTELMHHPLESQLQPILAGSSFFLINNLPFMKNLINHLI